LTDLEACLVTISEIDGRHHDKPLERLRAWKKMAEDLGVEVIEDEEALHAAKQAELARALAELDLDG
jgi:hypothetical protein